MRVEMSQRMEEWRGGKRGSKNRPKFEWGTDVDDVLLMNAALKELRKMLSDKLQEKAKDDECCVM